MPNTYLMYVKVTATDDKSMNGLLRDIRAIDGVTKVETD